MVYQYISQLANMQRRLIDKLAKNKGYSGTEGKIIHFLFANRDKTIYQKNIESVFGLRAATATQVLDLLEKKRLIRRVPSQKDGRYKEILLTEHAEPYKGEVTADIEFLKEQLIRGLAPEEIEIWCEITNKMIENLKETQK